MSLSGFDEISEAVFEVGKGVTEKAEQERKGLQKVYAPMLRILSCVTKWRESAVSGSQNVRERDCAVSVSENVREWVLGRLEYI